MNKYYKLRIKITDVISTTNWWYMGCKICWRRLKVNENSTYQCPECTETTPCPRYKIALCAIDLETEEEQNPGFVEFSFFGKQGEIITGQNVDLAVANVAGRARYTPPEIEELPGKKFIVMVTHTIGHLMLNSTTFKCRQQSFCIMTSHCLYCQQ